MKATHSNSRFSPWFAIATAVFLLFFAGYAQAGEAEKGFRKVEPYPAPTIHFANEQGKPLSLEDFKGKVLFINFWATWCAPCVKEMPLLDHIQKEWGGKGLEVLAISEDIKLGMPKIKSFYQTHNITNLPAYLDTNSKTFVALGLKGLPYSYIIDRKGQVRAEIKGPEDLLRFEIREFLDTLVGEPVK